MGCRNCGHENVPGAKDCESCGMVLMMPSDSTESFEPISPVNPGSSTQMRQITVTGPSLLVTKGPNEGEAFTLNLSKMSIGRDPDNDIFLDDVTVSRKHATISFENGQYFLADDGSLNGTYVNQERIDSSMIKRGDEIQIGKYKMILLAGAERRRNA